MLIGVYYHFNCHSSPTLTPRTGLQDIRNREFEVAELLRMRQVQEQAITLYTPCTEITREQAEGSEEETGEESTQAADYLQSFLPPGISLPPGRALPREEAFKVSERKC